MQHYRKFWLQIGFILCTSIFLSFPVSASEKIVIGILHRADFAYADMMQKAYSMALEVINKEGGVNGHPIKLVFADDRGKRREGQIAVEKLIVQNGAVMLVGGYSSSNTLDMARVADRRDRPFLVCTAADDRITQRQLLNIYRLNPPASEYANGLEKFMITRLNPSSMSIIYENSPYGTGGALQMMWFCRENDIAITAILPYHKERASEAYFKKILTHVQKDVPDVIYMVSYLKDAALLVKTIRALNIKSLLSGGAGGFTHEKFISLAGAAAEKTITATLWSPHLQYSGTQTFFQNFLKRYGIQPDYHGAEAYAALLVAADALRRAKSLQPKDIREALNATQMMTPFGPVHFKSYKNFQRQNRLPTQVLQIMNNRFETIWPLESATADFQP